MPSYADRVLDLRRLRYFLAVARAGSFSRAAEELRVAQSAVSRQVALLEKELGTPLLTRTAQGVELTPAGRLLQERGARLARDADALFGELRRFAAGDRGRLALGYSTSLGYETAPQLLRRLRAALPDADVDPVVLPSPALPDALRGGDVDLALLRCAAAEPDLEAALVRRERLGAVLPGDHAYERPLTLAALRDRPLLLHDRAAHPAHYDLIVGACRAAGFEPRVLPSAFDPTFAAVAAGEAIALVGESSRDALPSSLTWMSLRGAPRIEVSLLWRAPASPLVSRALAALP
jgi:LysR family transcriptional regulator, benzoate and cis,cis-muconate-responsive activator of ben and cat genes